MVHVCAGCSTSYAVGLPRCPECGGTERRDQAASMLPQMQVACPTGGCRAEGNVVTVRLPVVGVNLVQFPAVRCALCGAQVRIVTPWPPQPGEREDSMPKITRHGGPSSDTPVEPGTVPMEAGTGQPAGDAAPDDDEQGGGEESSPGSSSETSSAKQSKRSATAKPASQKRARTTASRSAAARTEGSSAPGTDGDRTEPTSETT